MSTITVIVLSVVGAYLCYLFIQGVIAVCQIRDMMEDLMDGE